MLADKERTEDENCGTADLDSVFSDEIETLKISGDDNKSTIKTQPSPAEKEPEISFFMEVPILHRNTTIKLPIHDMSILLCKQNMIGQGSYGKVYKYECSDSKIVVGLKHLQSINPLRCEEEYAKFTKEIDIHTKLNHENVIKFYGSLRYKGPLSRNVIMILEYAAGGSLTAAMEDGRFDRRKILGYTKQILQGLEYLHSFIDNGKHSPIIHRDLRGHNILLTDTGMIKIADFGICKQLSHMSTKSGSTVSSAGNAFWKAPEVISGTVNKRRIHLRVKIDIWSLGIVMLEMFYGGSRKVPFIDYYTYPQYIFKLGQFLVPRAPPEAPKVVRNLMKLCFEYYPQNRQSAHDLLDSVFSKMDPEMLDDLEMPDSVPTSPVMRSTEEMTLIDESTLEKQTSFEFGDDRKLSSNGFSDSYVNNDEEDPPHLTPAPMRKFELLYEEARHSSTPTSPSASHKRRSLLNSKYRSKQTEKFLIISKYERSHSFIVIRKSGPETNRTEDDPIFVVEFDTDGRNLTLKDDRDMNIYSITNLDKSDAYISKSSYIEGAGTFGKVRRYKREKLPFTKKRVKVTEISNTDFIRSMESVYSAASVMFGSSSLVIKENKKILRRHNPDYTYTIRFKGTKKEVGKFDIDYKKGICEIMSLEGTDAAIIITVTSFYLREKLGCTRPKFMNQIGNLFKRNYTPIDNEE